MAKTKTYLKIFKRKYLSLEDCGYLNELLKSSLSLKEALPLIRNNSNKQMIKEILTCLKKGQMVEEVLPKFFNKEISSYMQHLIKNLSFQESLSLSMLYIQKTKENIKTISKDILYPIALLFVSLSAMFLFDQYGLDSIVNLMNSFNSDIHAFLIIRQIFRIAIESIYILFVIVLLVLLYFASPKRITLFYLLLSKYFPHGLLKTYFTKDFVSLFLTTSNLGYKTKESLKILSGLHNRPLISFLAFHMEEELIHGSSLKEASEQKYFDETLARFIQIASYSNNFKSFMENYLLLAQNRMKNKMKRLTITLQALSYIAIGGIIVFIYQVLFLPMQALSSF